MLKSKKKIIIINNRMGNIPTINNKLLAGPDIPNCTKCADYSYSTYSMPMDVVIVSVIPIKCPKCNGKMGNINYHIIAKSLKFKFCTECHFIYATPHFIRQNIKLIKSRISSIEDIDKKLPKVDYEFLISEETKAREKRKKKKKNQIHKIYNSTSIIRYNGQVIHVYIKFSNYCTINHQEYLQSLTMRVSDSVNRVKEYDVNVYYCSKCKKYFINYEIIDKYLRRKQFLSFKYRFMIPSQYRKQYSQLRILGYNVKQNGLTTTQRENLLSWIIDNKLMSKTEIIYQLQDNISFSGKKSGMENAVNKWNNDILFVSKYIKGNTKTI